jgi:hypothetical protein
MDVSTFQGVVVATLFGSIVEDPGVGELGMKPE